MHELSSITLPGANPRQIVAQSTYCDHCTLVCISLFLRWSPQLWNELLQKLQIEIKLHHLNLKEFNWGNLLRIWLQYELRGRYRSMDWSAPHWVECCPNLSSALGFFVTEAEHPPSHAFHPVLGFIFQGSSHVFGFSIVNNEQVEGEGWRQWIVCNAKNLGNHSTCPLGSMECTPHEDFKCHSGTKESPHHPGHV